MLTAFWHGFEKRAAAAEEQHGVAQGVGASIAGGAALAHARPLATGRTTLYHGTSHEAAKSIRQRGLTAGHGGISATLEPELSADKLVYMTPHKPEARAYADQAQRLHGGGAEAAKEYLNHPERNRNWMMAQMGHGKGETLQASVPLWKYEVLKNPELRGATNGAEWAARAKKQFPAVEQMNALQHQAVYDLLDRPALKTVPAEHFKGSPFYKGLTAREIGQYARARPGRFAGGVALGAAGVGALGYGAHKLRQAFAQRKEAMLLSDYSDPDTQTPTLPPEMQRTISKAGPVLADLTEESDRSKFTAVTGVPAR